MLTAVSTASPATATAKPAISSDFDTFLKLLTTQMTHQDPLNPVDLTQFATQLATFSGSNSRRRPMIFSPR